MNYFKTREKAYKYLSNAINYFFENNYKSAEENFKKVISLKYDNASIESYYYLSFIKDLNGENEAAEYFYNQGNSIKPLDDKAFITPAEKGAIDFYHSLAEEFCNRNNYELAIKCNEKILKIGSNNSSAYCHISLIKSLEKKYHEALCYINKAIEIHSDEIYYFYRGNYNVALNNFEEANNDYSKTIELNPYSSNALKERAKVNIELKNYTEAISDLNKSLELNPYDKETNKLLKDLAKINH